MGIIRQEPWERNVPTEGKAERPVPNKVQPIDFVPACIDIEEPMLIHYGQPKIETFTYSLGVPLANKFTLHYYLTEDEAEEDINPLDVKHILKHDISPEHPQKKRAIIRVNLKTAHLIKWNGFVEIEMLTDRHRRLYAKIRIHQPNYEHLIPA